MFILNVNKNENINVENKTEENVLKTQSISKVFFPIQEM